MLPILRASLLGSVLVGMFVLVAGWALPAVKRAHVARLEVPARGPLIDEAAHPEWKQFLVLAALQRAQELERLRELPDEPMRASTPPAPPEPRVVTLPAERADAEPEDATGTIDQTISTIPVDIGAASSSELPIQPRDLEPLPELRPPETKKPADVQETQAVKPPQAAPLPPSRRPPPRRARAAKPPVREKTDEPALFNPFAILFGGLDNDK